MTQAADALTGTAQPSPGAVRAGRVVEIDGLRAIALTLVVVYHLFGHGRVSGGVDVFLFVSGVVLALSLVSGAARGRPVGVLGRWSRTFARLAPPAAIVLLAVTVMSVTILPPWLRAQNLVEVASSALYVENWQLIASQLAYGAAGPLTSPVQHFWSLSIQGQLFLVTPLVVAGVYALGRAIRRPGATLWVLATVATAGSFVYAAFLHGDDPQVAYFDGFARFWEFGAGLLVGGLLSRGVALPARGGAALGWLGLIAVLASGLVVDGALWYPGPAALLPVVGAALVVLSSRSEGRTGPGVLLRSGPLRGFSRISYSLYLWHWPVLIAFLAVAARADGVVGWRGAAFVLALSIALAVATWWAVERPMMRVARGEGWPLARPIAAMGPIAIVLVATLAAGFTVTPPARTDDTAGVQATSGDAVGIRVTDCYGAASLDPERPECAGAIDPTAPPLPAFESLRQDDDNRPECWAAEPGVIFEMCTLGVAEGYTRHLLAVGDSHNNTLIGVYEAIALARGWRIDVAGRPRCHWTDATRLQAAASSVQECREWNDAVDDYVATTDLDAIIVTNSSRAQYVIDDGDDLDAVRAAGYATAWAKRRDLATPVIAIRDNPIFDPSALGCLLHADRVQEGRCGAAREDVLLEGGLAAGVALDPNAHLIDLTDYVCGPQRCDLVVGGVIVVRDGLHLTATFARTLSPYLDREIAAIVG